MSEIFKGIDYAFNPHPPISAMKAAGVKFVGRYVSQFAANDINGKNLTASEFRALKAANMPIILFAEEAAGRMLNGHGAGVADAHHFDAVTKALGMAGAIMYCAADFDVSTTEQPAIHSYLEGAASVLGLNRTGLYGGYWPVRRALNMKKAAYAVQTLAWSGAPRRDIPNGGLPALEHTFWDGQTNWDTRARVRQHLQIRIGGASVDLDGAFFNDYGQWPRPAAPVPPPPNPIQVTADGVLSWRELAHKFGTPLQRSIWLTAINTPAGTGGFPQPRIAEVVRSGAFNDALPKGVKIWVG